MAHRFDVGDVTECVGVVVPQEEVGVDKQAFVGGDRLLLASAACHLKMRTLAKAEMDDLPV